MEIKQLKAFLAIAEAKTFTAGARRVNVTQAAISMQIRQLEDEVGLQLFTRTPRRVILTEAGEYLLDRARRILRERGGNTRRMIDDFFNAANVRPNIVMELSRQEAINQMVENNLGVGTVGAKTIADEIREGRLISWMIEGAEINWELGLARLRGGYYSPIAKQFVTLCKENFVVREKELKARK